MNRYLDIRILPDPEFAPNQLMNALFEVDPKIRTTS
jgi:hypothetical protein